MAAQNLQQTMLKNGKFSLMFIDIDEFK